MVVFSFILRLLMSDDLKTVRDITRFKMSNYYYSMWYAVTIILSVFSISKLCVQCLVYTCQHEPYNFIFLFFLGGPKQVIAFTVTQL